MITLHTVHASYRKDSLPYLSIYPTTYLSIPTTKAFSCQANNNPLPLKKRYHHFGISFFFFLFFFNKTSRSGQKVERYSILYPNIYIYKKKIRVSKDQTVRRNKDKNHFNKNTSFFFSRENASKFLASRYFRKGERCLATAGWHTVVYPILSYTILSLSDLFEPILYQHFFFLISK